MTNEQLLVPVIAIIVGIMLIMVTMVAIKQLSKSRHRNKRAVLGQLNISPQAGQRKTNEPGQPFTESEPKVLTAEESEAELERLQKFIEGQKQIAWNTDISHHLWDLYKNLLPRTSPHSWDGYIQDGEWYDVKILQASTQDGLSKLEFELKGARYTFIDDEEKQGWRDLMKFFSLFLYDDSDRCLIEIPMKMKVDSEGSHYSILSGGPNAFLPGGWISDFIKVKLKHQRIRNQEIRAQKHQERLDEIEELKARFGILD